MALTTSIVSFSYTNTPKPGFKLVSKRYIPTVPSPNGITLLFAHCTGAHKELWEPVIEALFRLKDPVSGAAVFREAWSVDWQTHGDSAIANEQLLKQEAKGLSVEEYATGLRELVSSEYLIGHQIVGIGHSAGATAILLPYSTQNVVTYKSIILVEPSLTTRAAFDSHLDERTAALAFIQKATSARRDIWPNRDEATQYFKKRLPWKAWDPRILDLYTKHGLRDVEEQEQTSNIVALKCHKSHEQQSYIELEPHFQAVERLATLDESIPVHCILGKRIDAVPKEAHESVLAVRKMASIQYVSGAGHFVLQEKPDGVASCIGNIILGRDPVQSKL